MTTLSFFLPSLSPPLPPNHLSTSQTQQLSHYSILCPKLSSTSIIFQPRSIRRHRTVALGEPKGSSSSSRFLDENGAVDDMDGYLNHLSLEYDSVWDTKPSWCQPWTITLTGVSIIACSWVILHSVIVTAAVLSLICAWWYIFLFSYPKAYSDMIAERRTKVTTGVEDTFGSTKSQ
ncbi:hypothetical protein LguiA_020397 [Lonicera macranthoides]